MEAALKVAFLTVLPGINYKFCNFHVAQAVFKRFKKKRLGFMIRTTLRSRVEDKEAAEQVKRWVCGFANLAYLPPERVKQGIGALARWMENFNQLNPGRVPTEAAWNKLRGNLFLWLFITR
jgi:hypothetical protein